MNEMLLFILLIIFGLICGFGLTFLVAFLREGTTSKKIDKMLSDAEKNADKIKRDAVMEAKEKSYQLKLEVDKDIKDAIKLARDKSHPDNGGSSDEFIRFQQLYERICK